MKTIDVFNTNLPNLDMNLGEVWEHGVAVIFRGSLGTTRPRMGDGVVVMGMDIMGWDVGCGWGLRGGGSSRDERVIELTRGDTVIRGVGRT